ncbi:MAG: hypothetical protein II776_02610 [Clostridia bacterium]|nr:hypothetical protein [Clostridia bacterium]
MPGKEKEKTGAARTKGRARSAEKESGKEAPRKGRFSWLALLLLILTAVGLCLSLRPRGVEAAWRATVNALKERESAAVLAERTLSSGTVAAVGEGKGAAQIEARFALPGAASLSVKAGEAYQLSAAGDEIVLKKGDETLSGERRRALAALDGSAFAAGEDELARGLRAFVLLAEIRDGGATAPYEKILRRNLPGARSEQTVLEMGEEKFSVRRLTYEFDAARLSKIFAGWQKTLPGDEALRQWATDLVRSGFALRGQTAPEKTVARIEDLLSGADGAQARIASGLEAGKGDLKAEFYLAGATVARIRVTFDLPLGEETVKGSVDLYLGQNVKKAPRRTFAASLTFTGKDVKDKIAFSLTDTVTENSGNAFIRDTEASFSDPAFRLLPAAEGDDGKREMRIKFSWGKKRGDLGLRFTSEERTVQFRGELTEYKAGNRAAFILRRIEVDGENRIPDQSYTVTVRPGGTPEALTGAKPGLFAAPQPETEPETEPETGEAQP